MFCWKGAHTQFLMLLGSTFPHCHTHIKQDPEFLAAVAVSASLFLDKELGCLSPTPPWQDGK